MFDLRLVSTHTNEQIWRNFIIYFRAGQKKLLKILIAAQLLDNLVQAMLHAVGQIKGLLAYGIYTKSEHLAHVLQRGFVALARLEGLGAAHQCLDVVGLVF
jgi:hypothetical protein